MIQITNLSDQSDMLTYAPLADGSTVQLEFIYRPNIQRWAFNVVHPDLTLNGQILVAAPNVLRPWKNICPFGLFCSTTDGADPFNIEDFASGRVTLYVLDGNLGEVAFIEENIYDLQEAA